MSGRPLTAVAEGVLVRVHVQPRASRTEIVGRHGDALKIRLKAPPVEGAANDELVRFLAERLGGLRGVALTRGRSSRAKTVLVTGVSIDQVAMALGLSTAAE